MTVVDERTRRRVGRVACFAYDYGPVAAKVPAAVQIRQRDEAIRILTRWIVGVLLVLQALILKRSDRIGEEHPAGARATPEPMFAASVATAATIARTTITSVSQALPADPQTVQGSDCVVRRSDRAARLRFLSKLERVSRSSFTRLRRMQPDAHCHRLATCVPNQDSIRAPHLRPFATSTPEARPGTHERALTDSVARHFPAHCASGFRWQFRLGERLFSVFLIATRNDEASGRPQ
jgi:hypothetical protein